MKFAITTAKIREELVKYDELQHSRSAPQLEFMSQEYYEDGDYESALYFINQVLELNPTQYSWYKSAQIHFKLFDYDYALSSVEESLKLQSDYQNALDLKEMILEKIKTDKDYLYRIYQ